VLYGPRGSGKSTLVSQLHTRFAQAKTPCGVAQYTACLDDITRTLEAAYPDVSTQWATRTYSIATPRLNRRPIVQSREPRRDPAATCPRTCCAIQADRGAPCPCAPGRAFASSPQSSSPGS